MKISVKKKQKQINLNLFNGVSLFYFGSVSLKLKLEYNQCHLKISRNSMQMISITPLYITITGTTLTPIFLYVTPHFLK